MAEIKKEVSKKREHWAWYFFDFGNSAYAAVVLLAVYSAYFKDAVVGGTDGSRWWGIATGIAMLTVALIAPVLGTLADFSGKKKQVLFVMTSTSVVFTALLFTVGKGDLIPGVLFFVIAEVGYRGGQVFYNSLLPEIASQDEIGKVSGNGWAFGSLGGIVCLLIVLGLILMNPGDTAIVRVSFLITAVFFAASTVPLFLWVRERAEPQALAPGDNYFKVARRRLTETIKSVGSYKEFLKFMAAFLIYNDGILSALNFAAIIGAVLYDMDQQQLIIMMIIVQVTSVAGAYVYGILGERLGFKRGLVQSLLLMIAAVLAIYFNTTMAGFLIIVAVAGFALTGVQSLSRTMIGAFAPPGKSGEFYGFFGMVGRTSSFIGPFLFGWLVDFLADNMVANGILVDAAEQTAHRQAVFLIIGFLVVGLGLLAFVNEKQGRRVALGQAVSEPGD
jgi:UMF1 family MFS transporter